MTAATKAKRSADAQRARLREIVGLANAELTDAIAHRARLHIEHSRGALLAFDNATGPFEDRDDVLAFDLDERGAAEGSCGGWRTVTRACVDRSRRCSIGRRGGVETISARSIAF